MRKKPQSFAIIETLAQLKSVDGLAKMLRDEIAGVQKRNPVVSLEKEPLIEVEHECQMEIGLLAFEKTGNLNRVLGPGARLDRSWTLPRQ